MSNTKLNAEELAYNRRVGLLWTPDMERAYAAAIREVAKPIADERDEMLEALREFVDSGIHYSDAPTAFDKAIPLLAKYPNP